MQIITNVRVEGLLHDFDHEIRFPSEWDFVLLYGPNGVGKTRLLELIHFLLNRNLSKVGSIPFSSLTITYDDLSQITVLRRATPDSEEDVETIELDFSIKSTSESEQVEWSLKLGESEVDRSIRRYIEASTSWSEISPGLWEDSTDGELIDEFDLFERFRPRLASRIEARYAIPESIARFLDAAPMHLIETQRLSLKQPIRRRGPIRGRSRSTIAEYSEDLRRQISRALAENSKKSQNLDRSFPERILDSDKLHTNRVASHDDQEIRQRYEDQNTLRQRLSEVGLSGSDVSLPLPQRPLEPWEKNVLWTYLDDTDEKLKTFNSLLERIELLREIINGKFIRKNLQVRPDLGLVFVRDSDGQNISPDSLSSGEQHELVLLYDLLFNVQEGSTVLIDEPEISLHIAWQKSFIEDIAKIANIASLRFIIATHSPQVINKSWNQAVPLSADRLEFSE